MGKLINLLLPEPLPSAWLHGILFVVFSFHMLFVLLTLGTAFLALFYFVHMWWGGRLDELRWDKKILRTFLAHKSLAVVLGVGPLLLLQLSYTVPFFNGISLFAPYWMLLIAFLIVAFLSFDTLGHKIHVHPYLHLFAGILGLASLLLVPGIFVLVLVASENSDQWLSILQGGYQLSPKLAAHWLLRFLHVLGAAVIFGAAFHYFFTSGDDQEKRHSLAKWMLMGLLFQFMVGPVLALSLPRRPELITVIFLVAGILAAILLLWKMVTTFNTNLNLSAFTVTPILAATLISMLLVRQDLQNRSFIPLTKITAENSSGYAKVLDAYRDEAVSLYQSDMRLVYDNGETIYERSCAFCHGAEGNGKGPSAGDLTIPPEDIASVRTTRGYLHRHLAEGMPGTAMPYFAVFDKTKLERVIDYLDRRFRIIGLPEPVARSVPDSDLKQAGQLYAGTCAQCHGPEGRATTLGNTLRPKPPDLASYSLQPERCFDVISNGYPGTMMPAFEASEPEAVRWGLVTVIFSLRGR